MWRWIKNIYIYIYWTHLFYKYLKVGATKSDTSIYNTWGREENIRNKWRNFDIKYLGKLSTTFPGKLGNTYKSRWSPIFSQCFHLRKQTVSKSHFHSIVHHHEEASSQRAIILKATLSTFPFIRHKYPILQKGSLEGDPKRKKHLCD